MPPFLAPVLNLLSFCFPAIVASLAQEAYPGPPAVPDLCLVPAGLHCVPAQLLALYQGTWVSFSWNSGPPYFQVKRP